MTCASPHGHGPTRNVAAGAAMTYGRATRIWAMYIPMIQFETIIHTFQMI
jgi:hypothetical protein